MAVGQELNETQLISFNCVLSVIVIMNKIVSLEQGKTNFIFSGFFSWRKCNIVSVKAEFLHL